MLPLKLISSIFLFHIISVVYGAGKELPKGIKKCSTTDKTCIQEALHQAFTVMKGGSQEYGIPEIDPLFIKELIIDEGNGKGAVNLKLKFNDLKITGLSDFEFSNVNLNLENNTMSVDTFSKVIDLVGKYEMDGKILILTLGGKGACKVTLNDVISKTTMHFNKVVKNGDTYWDVDDYKIELNPQKAKMNFEKLLNTNQASLNEGLNQFINENWSIILDTIKPSLNEAFGLIFKDGAKRFFKKVPAKNIFIDSKN